MSEFLTQEEKFNIFDFDIKKYDKILNRGLCRGMGTRGKNVCIEAAICQVLGLPHDDDPLCVEDNVRELKIDLNDCQWTSMKARAEGLHDLGLAQLGSKGVVDGTKFLKMVQNKIKKEVIPEIILDVFPEDKKLVAAAKLLKRRGGDIAARNVRESFNNYPYSYSGIATKMYQDMDCLYSTSSPRTYSILGIPAVASAVKGTDKYLIMCANVMLEVLKKMKSPGCKLLENKENS
jgi:hypothetical protein